MTDQTFSDAEIRAAFIARSEGSPSPELGDRIGAAARRTRQLPKLVVLPGGIGIQPERLLWAAAISATSLALVGGLLFAGRQPDEQTSVVPPASPSPSQPVASPPTPSADPSGEPQAAPSDEPSPAGPTADPSAPPAVAPQFAVDQGLVTLVGDLRVRSLPTVGESSGRLEPLLPAGMRLIVIEEPVAANGYLWYHVVPFESRYPAGWVAAGSRGGESWIGDDRASCPALPLDAAERNDLGVYGGLACFGDQELQLTGELTCTAADVDLTIDGPSWLRGDRFCTLETGDSVIQIHDDGIGAEAGAGRSNGIVTGHYADPQSASCVWAVDPPVPDPAEITATCRTMFVATDWKSVPID